MCNIVFFTNDYRTILFPGPEGFIHLFIGSYIYKLKEACPPNESCVIPGYPQPIKTVYKRAPRNIGAAAFIPDERQWTYFFKGKKINLVCQKAKDYD